MILQGVSGLIIILGADAESWFPSSPPQQSSQFGTALISGHSGIDAVWLIEKSRDVARGVLGGRAVGWEVRPR